MSVAAGKPLLYRMGGQWICALPGVVDPNAALGATPAGAYRAWREGQP